MALPHIKQADSFPPLIPSLLHPPPGDSDDTANVILLSIICISDHLLCWKLLQERVVV